MTPDPNLKWRIDGSAHTHRGHFHVCAIGEDRHRSVNMSHVVEASPDALIWLAGFLHGQEPEFFEFMVRSDELDEAADEADYDRWRDWNDRFRKLGYPPSELNELPRPIPELDYVVDPVPWTFVGGCYRIWQHGAWQVATPQPALNAVGREGWAWPGTLCEERGRHCLEQLDRISLCEDCHEVSV
jgi:hypothetical protein